MGYLPVCNYVCCVWPYCGFVWVYQGLTITHYTTLLKEEWEHPIARNTPSCRGQKRTFLSRRHQKDIYSQVEPFGDTRKESSSARRIAILHRICSPDAFQTESRANQSAGIQRFHIRGGMPRPMSWNPKMLKYLSRFYMNPPFGPWPCRFAGGRDTTHRVVAYQQQPLCLVRRRYLG